MPICLGKRKDGRSCSRDAKDGSLYCWQHEPDKIEAWREVYGRLAKATPEEKIDIVLRLIEEHPERKLELPEQEGIRADLSSIDLQELHKKCFPGRWPRWFDLRGANLRLADLQSAWLIGVDLREANLRGSDLRNANLTGADLEDADLARADLRGTYMNGCILRGAIMGNADLRGAHMNGVDLTGAQLSRCDLRDIHLSGILQRARLDWANLQQVDLIECDLTNIYIWNALLDKTRLRHEQLGGMIGEELSSDFENARYGYLVLKQNFDDLGDYDAASWAYCKERRMEKMTHWPPSHAIKYYNRELPNPEDDSWRDKFQRFPFYLRHFVLYISDWFVELLCDYGESIWRVLAWIVVVLFVIGPALVGWQGQLKWPEENYNLYFSLPTPWQQWRYAYIQNVLYMLDTFTTADFAQLEPANDTVRLISGFLAMTGIFLVGLLGFVVGNRIRRS